MTASGRLELRHPAQAELPAVQLFVEGIVEETYGDLRAEAPSPVPLTDWSPAWLAFHEAILRGAALAVGNTVDDLWVHSASRCLGIGSALLHACEQEIAQRGFVTAHLRLVSSNEVALAFYQRRGWREHGRSPHEVLPVTMISMSKELHG